VEEILLQAFVSTVVEGIKILQKKIYFDNLVSTE